MCEWTGRREAELAPCGIEMAPEQAEKVGVHLQSQEAAPSAPFQDPPVLPELPTLLQTWPISTLGSSGQASLEECRPPAAPITSSAGAAAGLLLWAC